MSAVNFLDKALALGLDPADLANLQSFTPQPAPAALTDAPTADDFNNLVTKLVAAGVLTAA